MANARSITSGGAAARITGALLALGLGSGVARAGDGPVLGGKTIAQWAQDLSSEDKAARIRAASILQSAGFEYFAKVAPGAALTAEQKDARAALKAAAPQLRKAARDPEERIQGAAISALGQLQDPDAAPILLEVARDASPRLQRDAIINARAIQLATKDARLAEALVPSTDAEVRDAAKDALTRVRPSK